MNASTHQPTGVRPATGDRPALPARHWMEFLAWVVLMFVTAAGIGIALGGVVLLLSGPASAAGMEGSDGAATLQPMREGDARQGALLFHDDEGHSFAVPLLHTDVQIDVSGPLAHTRVVQTFRNPSDAWYEGVYVFPLPDNAAVSRMRIRIGERVIEGEIRERAQARATYQRARQSGRRAALVEQERPNMFTTSVANIGPREEVVVELEYRQTLDYRLQDGVGRFSLRFPMVVGPRYVPAVAAEDEETGGAVVAGTPLDDTASSVASPGAAEGAAPSPPVRGHTPSDADRIRPPVARPGGPLLNPVRIRVHLDAGMPIDSVDSPYHAVHVLRVDDNRRLVTLTEGDTPANRDFELTWTLARGNAPSATLFSEPDGKGGSYAMLMLVPPAPSPATVVLRREVVFVIDVSGSMEGESITQAREALTLALRRLHADDRFNVIAFNHVTTPLFPGAVDAGAANIDRAVHWVAGLRASGGTEIAPALQRALATDADGGGYIRQVIFLTDGAVGNEQELFDMIHRKLGGSRLFTVGIGSAPNSYFMRKAAEAGRGSFTYIGKVDEVKQKMTALFARLETPVVTDIQVHWPDGAHPDAWPAQVSDLYLGQPLLVAAHLDVASGDLRVSGNTGAIRWQSVVALGDANAGHDVACLWARRKIEGLMDRLTVGADDMEIRRQVVPLAIEHRLLTRYTAFVAVDRTPARPDGAALGGGHMPTNLPHGWNYAAVFGELPRGATDARWYLLQGVLAMLLALPLLALLARRGDGAPRAH